jgi:glutamine synthetase
MKLVEIKATSVDYRPTVWCYSAVSIATIYGLDDREVGVRVPVGARIFSSPDRPYRL